MTLNILFFTITLRKREISLEEEIHNQTVEKLYEENRRRVSSIMNQL
ncbi:tandem small hypothetical protein [Mesobacillus persicus]|uniref:YrzI family small protein n=1 Tax=Mesobacillus persicus TaxID=930146 RepID=A0A1H7XB69_9BACI|nr:YrzI family small protein [Mesobacillus persicus]SEM30961.1 tandem small hypothetical protein [Mesobacillus persicus]